MLLLPASRHNPLWFVTTAALVLLPQIQGQLSYRGWWKSVQQHLSLDFERPRLRADFIPLLERIVRVDIRVSQSDNSS